MGNLPPPGLAPAGRSSPLGSARGQHLLLEAAGPFSHVGYRQGIPHAPSAGMEVKAYFCHGEKELASSTPGRVPEQPSAVPGEQGRPGQGLTMLSTAKLVPEEPTNDAIPGATQAGCATARPALNVFFYTMRDKGVKPALGTSQGASAPLLQNHPGWVLVEMDAGARAEPAWLLPHPGSAEKPSKATRIPAEAWPVAASFPARPKHWALWRQSTVHATLCHAWGFATRHHGSINCDGVPALAWTETLVHNDACPLGALEPWEENTVPRATADQACATTGKTQLHADEAGSSLVSFWLRRSRCQERQSLG